MEEKPDQVERATEFVSSPLYMVLSIFLILLNQISQHYATPSHLEPPPLAAAAENCVPSRSQLIERAAQPPAADLFIFGSQPIILWSVTG